MLFRIAEGFLFYCMAQQMGVLKITGTICGICFYCLDGVYYARAKSSLSAERVKKDPAFAGTRYYAKKMGTAAKIAAVVYRQLVPANERSRQRYREVVGMVLRELAKNERAAFAEKGNHGDTKTRRYTKKRSDGLTQMHID